LLGPSQQGHGHEQLFLEHLHPFAFLQHGQVQEQGFIFFRAVFLRAGARFFAVETRFFFAI